MSALPITQPAAGRVVYVHPELDLPACFANLAQLCDEYNRQVRLHNATCEKDNRKQPIRAQHRRTMELIIREMGGYLARHRRLGMLPTRAFSYTNPGLAKKQGCDADTIIHHIDRLLEAGIIATKRWRGTRHGVQITVPDELLVAKADVAYTQKLLAAGHPPHLAGAQRPPLPPAFFSRTENFGHTEAGSHRNIKGNIPEGCPVDGSAAAEARELGVGRKQQDGDEGAGIGAANMAEPPQEQSTGGARRGTLSIVPAGQTAERLARWAVGHLWPRNHWPETVHQLVASSVQTWLDGFQRTAPEQQELEFRWRVEAARSAVLKNPHKFYLTPDPVWYFCADRRNEGFAGTHQWWRNHIRQVQRKKDVRYNLTVLHWCFEQLAETPLEVEQLGTGRRIRRLQKGSLTEIVSQLRAQQKMWDRDRIIELVESAAKVLEERGKTDFESHCAESMKAYEASRNPYFVTQAYRQRKAAQLAADPADEAQSA